LTLFLFSLGFHVQGPSGPLTVQLGDSVMLPCFVETPLPMEELEVEWKRNYSGSLVHLWQNGESRPESQNRHYNERAHFFSEEVAHGNFSLLLTNVTREDAGVYKCVVHTNQHSDETLIKITEIGFHVQGPSGSLTVQLGDSVMLPCFVETPLPMEELEVEWNRIDSGSLVHLWQNGESRPESQNQRYHERAHFFSEEVAHGNFSLLLTNVTREDAGVYKCVIHTNQHSDETLIEMEFERLVVSGAHIISAYAGEDITLNCSVDSHIPSEKIEEVSWKKRDEDLLLLLYLEGDILTELTHERFKGRVEFFSTEDRNKGNFSMRLKDVRTEDKGLYICSAFSGTLSDNTTVEVQRLG
ncbi:butyrophilin-like protein 2, partial [Silurus meridionalis]